MADPYGNPAYPHEQYDVSYPDPYAQQPYSAPPGAAQPVSGYPMSGAPLVPVAEPVLAQIGDMQVTPTRIRTPIGEFPLRGSQWTVTDAWTQTQTTPTWAIVLAVVGFFCLTFFSLLFLLAKETRYTGVVQVMVSSGGYQYMTRVMVISHMQVMQIHNQVAYVRSLAAM